MIVFAMTFAGRRDDAGQLVGELVGREAAAESIDSATTPSAVASPRGVVTTGPSRGGMASW